MRSKKSSEITSFIAIALIILSIATLAANAQSVAVRAVLSGVVTDDMRSIIPGASLTLMQSGRAISTTTSNDSGEFTFGEMPVGKYELAVSKEGFSDVRRTIVLDAAVISNDVTLAAGTLKEIVTVVMDQAEQAVNSTLKSEDSLHNTPRSISSIGSERIREQNFRQVADVLNYVPGTTPNSYRNGSYHFYSRGYRMGPEDTRVDGFVGVNVGSGGFGASMFGVEEAVVLRGPASLIYGQTGSPGGLINLVSKRPQENYFTRVDLRAGGYAGNGVSIGERPLAAFDVDSTGKLTKNGRIQYRGLFSLENANYFTANTRDRNQYVNGSLLFKLDRDGRFVLTPSAQFTRYYRPYGGGMVASPSSSLSAATNISGDPSGATINETDLSPLDVNLFGGRRIEETGWYGLDFRGVPTGKTRVNAAYRRVSFDTDINSFTPQATSVAQINQLRNNFTVSRVQAKSMTERNYDNFNADASYEWIANHFVRNTTQVGFYRRVLESRTTTALGAVPAAQSPINVYTGATTVPLIDNFPAIQFGGWTTDKIWNGFVQNRTSIANGKVSIAAGFNFGQQKPATGAVRRSGFIPNASIVVNPTQRLAVYASYSTSFTPVDPNLEDLNGRIGNFEPTIGKNYEFGAKYDLLDRRLSLTAAIFQNQIDNALVQSDVGVLNSNNLRYYIPAGTRRARGAEFTGDFAVRQDLRVTVGAAYTSAVYKGFPSGTAVSSSPIPYSWAEKTPHFSYNAYARYDRREGYLKGFGAGLGLIWQGKRLGSNGARTFASPDPLVLPSFTRVDSALFYRLNKFVNFAFNVENLLDEQIFVNASVGSAIELAAPRTMTLRTSFNF